MTWQAPIGWAHSALCAFAEGCQIFELPALVDRAPAGDADSCTTRGSGRIRRWLATPERGTMMKMGRRGALVDGPRTAVLALGLVALSPSEAVGAEASQATTQPAPTPEPKPKPVKPWTHRGHPILVLATGPLLGPHAFGNEQCRSEESECQVRGTFFGLGANLELRARLWKILYAHARPWVVGNVSNRGPIYRGMVGGGFGLGVYGQHAFLRGEYIALHAFGDNDFEPPFFEGEVATDTFGNHAGMVTAGFRRQLVPRIGIELWAGPMFGPKSDRRIPDMEPDRRLLITFMIGLSASFDLVGDPSQKR